MMDAKTLPQAEVAALLAELLSAGTRVIGPARVGMAPYDHVEYSPVNRAEDVVLGGGMPARSIKEFFMPPTEVLFRWKQDKAKIAIEEVPTSFPPTVIFGARPCDAAAVDILDKLMNWDYRDELWFGRRDATTIVTFACAGEDASCFCTAVGLGPEATRGSDLFLTPVDGGYHVDVMSPKGEALIRAHAKHFGEPKQTAVAEAFRAQARKKVEPNMQASATKARAWLEGHFEDAYWKELALRCHGCGACASLCPTCHCFDIVDEPSGVLAGLRRRNWDTCQTSRFTVHGSGHNPRHNQSERFRQRLMHKFAVYPRRFNDILCSGCGRCSRACPGGMSLPDVLEQVIGFAEGSQTQPKGAL